ncbi:MAG: hypothetical protein AB8G14_08590 [Ilumatobacter sp.]
MQEFRPANVIEADTELAERLISGDLEALDELMVRYARPVAAVVASRPGEGPTTVEVFARVWITRAQLIPGADFSEWIGTIAASGFAGADAVWSIAAAIGSVDGAALDGLHRHHVDGDDLPDELDRHELKLRRRLAQLGADDAIVGALSDPTVWATPDVDVREAVHAAIGVDRSSGDQGHGDGNGEAVADDDEVGDAAVSGRVSRSLRPALIGLGGAVAVLFVAIVALSAASGSPDEVAFTAELTPTGAVTEVEGGEITATLRDAGVQLSLDAPTLPRRSGDRYYEGVLVLANGSEVSAGTFTEGFNVTLWGAISLDRVDEFRVVARELGADIDDVVLKLDIPDS